MKLSGSLLSAPLLLAVILVLAFSSAFAADPQWAPVLTLPSDSSIRLCEADSVCYDLIVEDPDPQDELTLTLLEGPINFPPQKFGPNFIEPICFVPDTTGLYQFVWQLEDLYGHVVTDTVIFSISMNILPVIEDQYFSQQICFTPHPRLLPISAYDPDCDTLRYELLEGLGTIDKYTGLLEYEADTSGIYTFLVAVLDECVADTATIYDTVYLNQPPVAIAEDFTVRFCAPEEVCFDILTRDPEGSPVLVFHNEGPGSTTQLTDSTAQTCFMPLAVDSATYRFVYCLVDECPYDSSQALEGPSCVADTVLVTVIIDKAPTLICPGPQNFFTCAPDTFCFDVEGYDPEFSPLTFTVLSGNATIDGVTVCVEGDTNAQFDVVIEVVDSCGLSDTCTVPITIASNREPYITMADDFLMQPCQPETICFSAIADDLDLDLASIVVNYGSFDAGTNRICFDADTSGVYEIIMTATDGCGAFDEDTTYITVDLNETPLVSLADDFSASVCAGDSICFSASASDNNMAMLTLTPGFVFDDTLGQICFKPDSSGTYEAVLRLRDDCDLVVADTIRITVDFNAAPVVAQPMADSALYLCAPTPVCLPLTFFDADNDIVSISSNLGEYADGSVCFVPYGAGSYEIIVTALDACGNSVADTAQVTITNDEGIVILPPADTSIFLCDADTLCFPVSGIPEGAAVTVSGTGTWWNAETQSICFYSDCCIENILTVSATTDCGTYSASFTVTVETNVAPLVIIPQDTSYAFCEVTEIRLPLGVSDPDGNLTGVVVEGATYDAYRGELYFTPDTTGVYTITVTATDSCGLTDIDQIVLTVGVNRPPYIKDLLTDTIFRQCDLSEIRIPIALGDIDGNGGAYSASVGTIEYDPASGYWLVFTPTAFGDICIDLFVSDACGITASDQVCLTLEEGDYASIVCPPSVFVCVGEALEVPLEISGTPTSVTSSIGQVIDGLLNLTIDTAGVYLVDIEVYSECSIETCQIEVTVEALPTVSLNAKFEGDTLYLCGPVALHPTYFINEAVDSFTVIGAPGEWSTDYPFLELVLDKEGTFEVTMIAYGACGVDSSSINFTIEMNEAPIISANDTSVVFCQIEPVCLPVSYSDADGNIDSVWASMGELVDGMLCFTAPDFGDYEIYLEIKDTCGLTAVDTVTISVMKGEFVALNVPPVALAELCGPGQVCFPVGVTGTNYLISTDIGTYADGQVCFNADTSGQYTITITGDAGCNDTTVVVLVDVTVTEPVTLSCQTNDSTIFFCEPGHMMFPVSFTGDDVQLTVSPAEAWYENGFVHINVDTAGFYEFEVTATNSCNTEVCSFNATAVFNSPPVLVVADDSAYVACLLEEICLPISVTDVDGNLLEVRSPLGVVNDNVVCFTPKEYGDHRIIITAVDTCGAEVEDTILVSISEGSRVQLTCPPSPYNLFLTTPGLGRIQIPGEPLVGIDVTVLPFGEYDETTGEIVATFDTVGTYEFTIIADAFCNSESCTFTVIVDNYEPPKWITCDPQTDTAVCVNEPTTVCLPIEYGGTNAQVMVKPFGQIIGNEVCIDVDSPGEYTVELIVFNEFDTASCFRTLVILPGEPATLTLPQDYDLFACGPELVCVPLDIQRTDFDILSIGTNVGDYNSETGDICFTADTAGIYEVIATATDNCGNIGTDTLLITVTMNALPQISLGDDFGVLLCGDEEICVDVNVADNNLLDVIPNMGQYNPSTGQVCFQPAGEGSYTLIVEATDLCGAMQADTILIDVSQNVAPVIDPIADTTVYLCFPQYICLDVLFDDLDGNIETVSVNRGEYADGQICFVPYGQGDYEIILTVTDSCGLSSVATAMVTILTDQNIDLVTPGDTSLFLCEADTLSFFVGNIPAGATVSVSGTGTWWDDKTQSVMFYSNCCIQNLITVSATTECGTYSESFTVNVETNAKPLVIVPSDTAFIQCELTEICFPVGVSDPDGNLMEVTVEGATYDSYRGEACFTPTGTGIYTITITATDSCGAVDVDQIVYDIIENQPPSVSFETTEFFYKQCFFETICLDLTAIDVDGNFDYASVNYGTYTAETGQLCFMPDSFGVYDLIATAYDSCGAVDSAFISITVAEGDYVAIECPTTTLKTDTLCQPEEICHFLPIEGDNFEVTTSYGSWVDGRLCFQADSSGIYEITVIATSQCVTDTCVFIQPVKILEPVDISCPTDQEVFLCGRDTLVYDFTASESVTNITVSSPGYIQGGQLFVPILIEGSMKVTMSASGRCGKATCEFTITSDFNVAPLIADGKDTALVECSLFEVCLPLSVTDGDNNIDSLTATMGTINEAGDQLCFTPPDFGVYEIIIDVVDSCGKSDADTIMISFLEGESAAIICPEDNQFVSLCEPDTVCIIAPITPAGAEITIEPNGVYKPETGEICIWAEEDGSMPIRIIAKSQCFTDTCEFILEVEMGEVPVIAGVKSRIDTLLCLASPTTFCFDANITGTGVQVNVNPIGEYSAGKVCIPVDTAGTYDIEIIAFGTCGEDTAFSRVIVTADQLPQLFLPEDLTIERCPDDTNHICIDGIFATDAESDVTLTQICGPDEFVLAEPDSGSFCWLPEQFGLTEFCYEISDGCHTVSGSFTVNIVTKSDCEVCVRAIINAGESTTVGLRKTVAIDVETNDAIAGFDLLISYDASALTFVGGTIEDAYIEKWEYFTYNLNNGACGSACPSGIVRFVGIADVNNGANHPPDSVYSPQGVLLYMQFQIANDQNLGDQFIPISFVWYDCGDNTFSDASGSLLYMDLRILDPEGTLLWDEDDQDLFPDESRPFGMGSPDGCITGTEKAQPLRCVEFVNGGIKIKHPSEIDDRGDVNLDGLAYTIADAVIFTNYFIHGLTSFTISIPGQVAATDVNADGITLSVADLVYMIRVIVGDVDPIPKVVPYPEELIVATLATEGQLTISSNSVESVGGAYLIYEIPSGLTVENVRRAAGASEMDLDYIIDGQELRLLLYNVGSGLISSGENDLFLIDISGSGSLKSKHLEFVDYQGRPYLALDKSSLLPTEFSLGQNYPNPFNPTTHIGFNLPQAGHWQLQIYSVAGTLVKSYDGYSEGGEVEVLFDGRNYAGAKIASGVYFYRLNSNLLSATKKMILLK